MRAWFGGYASVLLALIILISSLQMAISRHALMPVGSMVICSGNGTYTVGTDAEGNPTEDVYNCPECTPVGFAAIEVSALDLAGLAPDASALETPPWSLPPAQVACITPQARDPPLSV